jgi:hypothetical protein
MNIPVPQTTPVERFLLMLTMVIMPLESNLPTIDRYSVLFVTFAASACYALFKRPTILSITALHPVFMAAYGMIALGFLVESGHPNTRYSELIRLCFMIAGGVVIASLCRDRRSLRFSMYGYMIAGVWLSFVLLLTSYSSLTSGHAVGYQEATQLRIQVFSEGPLAGDLNSIAFFAVQAGVVAFALMLTAQSGLQRRVYLAVSTLCLVASFLPMSRSAVLAATLSYTTVMLSYRGSRTNVVLAAGLLVIIVLSVVPAAVFSRFQLESGGEGMRGEVTSAVLENVQETALLGVGAGNFWESWGLRNGFATGHGSVLGTHNVFFQILVFWGVMPLLSLVILIWLVYQCLPASTRTDGLALCLRGIALSLLCVAMFVHTMYDKQFSLGLGLIVAAHLWRSAMSRRTVHDESGLFDAVLRQSVGLRRRTA